MRSRLRVLASVLLAATLAAAFSTTLSFQLSADRGVPPPLWRLALLNGSFWFGWALLAWPLAASQVVVLRARIDEMSLKEGFKPDRISSLDWFGQWRTIYPGQMTQFIDWELATGLGIIAMAHAFFYYRETQRRALETRLVDAQLRALQSQLRADAP